MKTLIDSYSTLFVTLSASKVLNRHVALMEVLQVQCTGTLIHGRIFTGCLQRDKIVGNLNEQRGYLQFQFVECLVFLDNGLVNLQFLASYRGVEVKNILQRNGQVDTDVPVALLAALVL